MAEQEIRNIKVSDLRLWTENPRDPVDPAMTDVNIIKRAIAENPTKWNLQKMVDEMGPHYDFSELPTVVEVDGQPVVYDGNRRVAVLKYLQNQKLYTTLSGNLLIEAELKELRELKEIPCNVCDEDTALSNIERKHVSAGTWGPLERDYFLFTHRGEDKSIFVQFEEQSGKSISQNKKMNQGFVKKEVLTERNLKQIGISLDKDRGLVSNYDDETAKEILEKVVSVVNDGRIQTRGANRGKLKETLISTFPELAKKLHEFDKSKHVKEINIGADQEASPRKTPRSKRGAVEFFGGPLSLKNGSTNDLYRDISDLCVFYEANKATLSPTFPALIRMSLRLLVESTLEFGQKIDTYIKQNFATAKGGLSQDQRTFLSSQSVTDGKLVELLQAGAHNYHSSANLDQTVAMSVIIGEMLKTTHGKTRG